MLRMVSMASASLSIRSVALPGGCSKRAASHKRHLTLLSSIADIRGQFQLSLTTIKTNCPVQQQNERQIDCYCVPITSSCMVTDPKPRGIRLLGWLGCGCHEKMFAVAPVCSFRVLIEQRA